MKKSTIFAITTAVMAILALLTFKSAGEMVLIGMLLWNLLYTGLFFIIAELERRK